MTSYGSQLLGLLNGPPIPIHFSKTSMNSLFRPLLRTYAHRSPSIATRATLPALRRPLGLVRPERAVPTSIQLHKRMVASSVTNKPASQTLEHAATNVKEEIGDTATDVAKMIAGANVTTDAVSDTGVNSFVSTKDKTSSGVTPRALTTTPAWHYG